MADIAKEAGLQADEPMLAAASKVFVYLWDTAWDNAQGTLEGDADALHDMRVAMRRLRTVMQNFEGAQDAPIVPPHLRRELERQRRKVGKLGDALGAVRDFDVLKDHLKDYQEEYTNQGKPNSRRAKPQADASVSELETLKDFLKDEREAAFPAMVEQIEAGMEPGGLREKFARFALGLRAASAPPLLLSGAAQLIIPLRVEQVLRCAPLLHNAKDALGHHEFRKDLRRLRYSLEILSPCVSYAVAPQVKLLTELQDLLGEMQDTHVLCETTHDAFQLSGAIEFKKIKERQNKTAKSSKTFDLVLPKHAKLPAEITQFLIDGESRRHELLKQARDLWEKQQKRNWPQSLCSF